MKRREREFARQTYSDGQQRPCKARQADRHIETGRLESRQESSQTLYAAAVSYRLIDS